MKKGQMCEGIIEYIDFPNKGRVKVEDQYAVKADYWKYWRNLH